jgi:histidinol-phosphatase (PHP family)
MIDAHVHSHHSPDARGTILDLTKAALSQGLTGVVFTEHGEWYPADEAYGYLDLDAYFTEIDEARHYVKQQIGPGQSFTLFSGIELGNPHEFTGQVAALLDTYPFDLAIGSVHWIDNLPGWERPIFSSGIPPVYRRYFEELLTMVEVAEFDVLGHLDLVRRDSWDLFGQAFGLEPYAELIDAVLRRIVADGRGLEINTSALRKGLPEPVPDLATLRRYRELGGEILVIGSDAHRPEHVGHGFSIARDLLLAAGFNRLPRFEGRRITEWMTLD